MLQSHFNHVFNVILVVQLVSGLEGLICIFEVSQCFICFFCRIVVEEMVWESCKVFCRVNHITYTSQATTTNTQAKYSNIPYY